MSGGGAPRVAIVEDHPLFRETIAAVVDTMDELRLGPLLECASDALTTFAEDPPDLVLVDLSLSEMSGLDLVREIGTRWPDVRCIILSGHRRSEYARQALQAGALGYILKGRPDDFREGVRCVLAGGRYASEPVRPPDWDR
jgi:DNA-binding NarL/FixJ family response regulator